MTDRSDDDLPIEVVVGGKPQGKGRPRFGKGRTFTPAATRSYEGALKFAALAAMRGRDPLDAPLVLLVIARMPIPVSWPKRKQALAETGAVHAAQKPDFDNIAKVVDALNGIVWRDDSLIVDARILKFYSRAPSLTIRVSVVPEFLQ